MKKKYSIFVIVAMHTTEIHDHQSSKSILIIIIRFSCLRDDPTKVIWKQSGRRPTAASSRRRLNLNNEDADDDEDDYMDDLMANRSQTSCPVIKNKFFSKQTNNPRNKLTKATIIMTCFICRRRDGGRISPAICRKASQVKAVQ